MLLAQSLSCFLLSQVSKKTYMILCPPSPCPAGSVGFKTGLMKNHLQGISNRHPSFHLLHNSEWAGVPAVFDLVVNGYSVPLIYQSTGLDV